MSWPRVSPIGGHMTTECLHSMSLSVSISSLSGAILLIGVIPLSGDITLSGAITELHHITEWAIIEWRHLISLSGAMPYHKGGGHLSLSGGNDTSLSGAISYHRVDSQITDYMWRNNVTVTHQWRGVGRTRNATHKWCDIVTHQWRDVVTHHWRDVSLWRTVGVTLAEPVTWRYKIKYFFRLCYCMMQKWLSCVCFIFEFIFSSNKLVRRFNWYGNVHEDESVL